MKITKEKIFKDLICTAIRMGSYGLVAKIGWDITNKIAEKEISNHEEICKLQVKVNELETEIIENEIENLKK